MWPGLKHNWVDNFVHHCPTFCKSHNQPVKPLISSGFQYFHGTKLLQTHSSGKEQHTWLLSSIKNRLHISLSLSKLGKLRNKEVICYHKSVFARHSIPSNNGPQNPSTEFLSLQILIIFFTLKFTLTLQFIWHEWSYLSSK